MSDFAPVIVIEGFLAFGSVLLLYWLHLREMRKIRDEKARRERSLQSDADQV